ncbi:hypothetical protein AMIS_19830 [Actinoplanes missouriensis 431]|uniref:Uncharacterized protein n=1 Tax=Actinoplanes missouriensis (strain ATCC 14538 / DSM 43046 / CBS 188.64 / JCM 3121 / NBRC 102363 / NCIMB 12654 / NRRL B-3342 / UNCC 431) TaxID=512565 RepID=I0H2G6_ACTM4|nr:hypothetical protein [Actinoplanes missouriensis]BAL87203.1 hypothetical protein AMIS_19830 [Actinoplanes missouriensis 431]
MPSLVDLHIRLNQQGTEHLTLLGRAAGWGTYLAFDPPKVDPITGVCEVRLQQHLLIRFDTDDDWKRLLIREVHPWNPATPLSAVPPLERIEKAVNKAAYRPGLERRLLVQPATVEEVRQMLGGEPTVWFDSYERRAARPARVRRRIRRGTPRPEVGWSTPGPPAGPQ